MLNQEELIEAAVANNFRRGQGGYAELLFGDYVARYQLSMGA